MSSAWGWLKKALKVGLQCVGGYVAYTVCIWNPWVGAGLFSYIAAGRIKDPSWEVLAKICLWAVGAFLFHFAWEVYLAYCIVYGFVLAGRILGVLDHAIGEKGPFKGLFFGAWRCTPLALEPLFGVVIRRKTMAFIERHAPPTGSLKRFLSREYWDPDHNPYPKEEMLSAAKRPIRGRKRMRRGLGVYEGKHMPIELDLKDMEVGRRYLTE